MHRFLLKHLPCGLFIMLIVGCATGSFKKSPLTLEGSSRALRPGAIVETKTGRELSFESLMERLSDAKIVYVGETHTSVDDHRIQKRIAKGLYAGNLQPIVAMEMFPRGEQPVLDRYSRGEISEGVLLEEAGWSKVWGYPFQLYRDIMSWARDSRLEILGLNAPPDIVHKVARRGLASLTAEERSKVAADVSFGNSEHRKYIQEEYQQHVKGGIKDFRSFYEAQLTWEDTMAETLARRLKSLDDNERIIVLIGKGHITHKLGVPQKTWDRAQEPFRTVMPIPADYPERSIDPEIADFLWITGRSNSFHRGRLGVMIRPSPTEEGIEVLGVVPGSPAAKAGIRKGDFIREIDDVWVSTVDDVHEAVARKAAVHHLKLMRNGKEISLMVAPCE